MSAKVSAPIEYREQINMAVAKLRPVDMPLVNNDKDAAAQEYWIAAEVAKCAEARKADARDALLQYVNVPQNKGTHIVHDSHHMTVQVQVVSGPRTLDQKALLSALVKTFGLSLEDAERFIDACRKDGGVQSRLTVLPKR
jgi:hypothetical protein